MTDTTMIERVARAIYEGRNGKGAIPWSKREWSHREPYLKDARAAIEAMREPTLSVIEAGQEQVNLITEEALDPNAFEFLSRGEITDIWEAMIDAALSQT